MLRRLLERSTRPPVLTWFAVLQAAIALLLVARNAWLVDDVVDARCEAVVGDFIAFHAAARLVARGEGGALYDLDRQLAVQREVSGCSPERWPPYVNPPLLAVALVPFSAFGALTAFHLFGVVVTLALVAALLALVRALPALGRVPRGRATAGMLVFGFAPVAATLAGGQNTALSLALAAAFYAALAARRDVLAGTWLGLLSYKPTLLPVLLVVVALQRRTRVLAVAVAIVLAHYLVGAAIVGPDWPARLLETGVGRRSTELLVESVPPGSGSLAGLDAAGTRASEWEPNLPTHVSLPPFVERLVPGAIGSLLGLGLAAATVLAAVLVAMRSTSFVAVWGVAFAAGWLASPHLPYYDFGLVALPVLLGVEHRIACGRPLPPWGRLALLVAYLGYPAYTLSGAIGFQPLTLVLVLVLVWLRREALAPA